MQERDIDAVFAKMLAQGLSPDELYDAIVNQVRVH